MRMDRNNYNHPQKLVTYLVTLEDQRQNKISKIKCESHEKLVAKIIERNSLEHK